MAVYTPRPAGFQTDEAKRREMLHNQRTNQTFPYQTSPNQMVPVVRPPQAPVTQAQGQQPQPQIRPIRPSAIRPVGSQYTPGAGQQQMLQAGQQAVTRGFQTPTLDLTQQRTQDFLNDPMMGRDPRDIKTQKMDVFNREIARAAQRAKEEAAPVYGAGEVRGELADLGLRLAQERAKYSSELDEQLYDQMTERMLRSIEEGRRTEESARARQATQIGGIAQISGAMEGAEGRAFQQAENAIQRGMDLATRTGDQNFQLALTELQGKIQSGLMVQEQDFDASQAALDRQQQLTMQGTDINAKREFLDTQLDFDRMKMERGFDFTASQNMLDRNLKTAMQNKDLESQTMLLEKKLQYERMMQEAGFEFTAEQNALNRGLELTLQSGDQEFQENMLRLKEKIDLNIMATQNDWNAIQNRLDREKDMAVAQGNWDNVTKIERMKQEFASVQADKDREHEEDLQMRAFNQEKWKQGRVEQLTQMGWSHEEAMQRSQLENDRYMQDFEWKRRELLQQGQQEHEAEQNAKQWAFQSSESNLDRQLQREVEAGRLGIEEKRLAQEAMQFESRQEYDRWALKMGLSENARERMWQSIENSKDRSFQAEQEKLAQEFEMKGMKFVNVMAMLQQYPPEQAAETLKQMAVEAGITYVDEDGNVQQGIKPLSQEQIDDMQFESQMESIQGKLDMGARLTPEEYELYRDKGNVPEIFAGDMLTYTRDARGSRKGKRGWRFSDDAWSWLNANKGKTFRGDDGEIYVVEDFWEPGTEDRPNLKAYVTLRSLETGQTMKWQGGNVGEQEPSGLVGKALGMQPELSSDITKNRSENKGRNSAQESRR